MDHMGVPLPTIALHMGYEVRLLAALMACTRPIRP